jgi:hypothetical protein
MKWLIYLKSCHGINSHPAFVNLLEIFNEIKKRSAVSLLLFTFSTRSNPQGESFPCRKVSDARQKGFRSAIPGPFDGGGGGGTTVYWCVAAKSLEWFRRAGKQRRKTRTPLRSGYFTPCQHSYNVSACIQYIQTVPMAKGLGLMKKMPFFSWTVCLHRQCDFSLELVWYKKKKYVCFFKGTKVVLPIVVGEVFFECFKQL